MRKKGKEAGKKLEADFFLLLQAGKRGKQGMFLKKRARQGGKVLLLCSFQRERETRYGQAAAYETLSGTKNIKVVGSHVKRKK